MVPLPSQSQCISEEALGEERSVSIAIPPRCHTAQADSGEMMGRLMDNLQIFSRAVGTSNVSSPPAANNPNNKHSSFCAQKRRLLTGRQAGGTKPAMIKGAVSK